jgi:thiol:disulfide interchange protein
MKYSNNFILARKWTFCLCGFLFFHNCLGQQKKENIHFFEGLWNQAVSKAKLEKKCIFLDAYASWCGPCKTMDAEVYTNPKVADYFNRKFISFRIDMEKGEGPELAKQFRSIDGYPSLLFFNPDGSLAKTILGSRLAPVFLQEGKMVAESQGF